MTAPAELSELSPPGIVREILDRLCYADAPREALAAERAVI